MLSPFCQQVMSRKLSCFIFPLCGLLLVLQSNEVLGQRQLVWTPQTNMNWNESDLNWRAVTNASVPTAFMAGDFVSFQAGSPVFIGTNGIPGVVAPAAVNLEGNQSFSGGDILTGSIQLKGTAYFTNYAASLSFPGGTTVLPSSRLTYDLSLATNGAAVHFGTGPISFSNAQFNFAVQKEQTATLKNDLVFAGNSDITLGTFDKGGAVARLAGTVYLGGRLMVWIQNGKTNWFYGVDAEAHELAGPLVLEQSAARDLSIGTFGSYRSKGLLLSGGIADGPGSSSNRLTLQNYAVPFIRLSGSNTYSRGTFIASSPSAPKGLVEVAPESSLGSGNVEVDFGGVLHLMGDRNIASNASVHVKGQAILDPGVKIRLKTLRLGDVTHTSGLFTMTNAPGFLVSNGTFRLPMTNLPPTAALTQPFGGMMFSATNVIQMQAAVSDTDGYLERVQFLLNGAVVGVRSNAPFNLSISNAPAGAHVLSVIAYDDDGGAKTSAPVHVVVGPRLKRIEAVGPGSHILEFDTAVNRSSILQYTDELPALGWTNLQSFPGGSTSLPVRITNSLPSGTTKRFYRLWMP